MAKHEDVDYQFNKPDNTNPVSKMRHRTQVSASSFYPWVAARSRPPRPRVALSTHGLLLSLTTPIGPTGEMHWV
jgi:hypothetical protein